MKVLLVNGSAHEHGCTDAALQDSAMSVGSVKQYSYREFMWGANFHYYEYLKPLDAKGVLADADIVHCSNGQVYKAREWNFDKLMTFHRYKIIQAESSSNIKVVSKYQDSHGDSLSTITPTIRYVTSDNSFYDKVWDNAFVEFQVNLSTQNPVVTFTLSNVLSNIGYDIYLVTSPALASDSTAREEIRRPTILRCSITQPGKKAVILTDPENEKANTFTTLADEVGYIKIADDYKFDVCTYGLDDEDLQVTLDVETRVTSGQIRNNTHNRVMRIDCILLVPHGSLELVAALPAQSLIPSAAQGTPGLLMYPHGKYDDRSYKWWYMQR